MTPQQKFEVLKIELSLIQSTLDKYDDLIFRARNFFITLWIACIGLAFTIEHVFVILLAPILSFIYWLNEGIIRYKYKNKYIDRYRFLRDSLNNPSIDLINISIYDLTNSINRKKTSCWDNLRNCFFSLEPSILYGLMGFLPIIIWLLFQYGFITFLQLCNYN